MANNILIKDTIYIAGDIVRSSTGKMYAVYARDLNGFSQIYYATSLDDGLTWTETGRLSNVNNYNHHDPRMTIDPSDNWHVTWAGQYSTNYTTDQIIYTRSDGIVNVTYESTAQANPRIVSDSQGNLSFLWEGPSGGSQTIWFRQLLVSGGWQTAQNIASVYGYNDHVGDLCVGPDDSIHAVWSGVMYGYAPYHAIHYRKYSNSTWGQTQYCKVDYTDCISPSIVVDFNSIAHIVFAASNELKYFYYPGPPNITALGSVGTLDPTTITPDISLYRNGDLIVSWSDDASQNICYRKYTGSWESKQTIDVSSLSTGAQKGPVFLCGSIVPYINGHYTNLVTGGVGLAISLWKTTSGKSAVFHENALTWDSIPVIPTVTTGSLGTKTSYSFNITGEVTKDGNSTIISRGFCMIEGDIETPTIYDKIDLNSGVPGVGAFSNNVSGVKANTSYRVRAFAINDIGVGYGETITITTNNIKGLLIKF